MGKNINVEKWLHCSVGWDGENYSFNSIKSNPSTWQSSYQVIPRWVSEAEGSGLKLPTAATHLPQWQDNTAGCCCSALNKGFKLTLSMHTLGKILGSAIVHPMTKTTKHWYKYLIYVCTGWAAFTGSSLKAGLRLQCMQIVHPVHGCNGAWNAGISPQVSDLPDQNISCSRRTVSHVVAADEKWFRRSRS